MKKFLVVIEKTRTGYSAFCPDLSGCAATGKTKSGVLRSLRSAINFHLEGMIDSGQKIPNPKSTSTYLEL